MEDWKNSDARKPILIDGARQTGKTWLVEKLFAPSFRKVHSFDFRENKQLHEYFSESLEPGRVLDNLMLHVGEDFDLANDLIFFDEIGECQGAVDSLKYFADYETPLYLCASGSNIGLLQSFPVGKVKVLNIWPMSFEEFLMASGDTQALRAYREQSRLMAAHTKLWKYLLDYFYVGGMPEAVASWFGHADAGINSRVEAVSQVHSDLVQGYYRDFGKYSGHVDSMHIERVFNNVPVQLAKTLDNSVKRFVFKDVIPHKKRYLELSTPIDWLCKTKLISKSFLVDSAPRSPLKSLIKENMFKLYFFDLGILGHILEIGYQEQIAQKFIEKGFVAENFVQNELVRIFGNHTYFWSQGQSEIEFLLKVDDGSIVPVEVKSGKRTRAKSLMVYRDKYQPKKTIKLVGAAGGSSESELVWPLYYASYLDRL
ncbi:ATP-binding protein [Pseudobacteriovorax antillogorgiicola]|uniref:ATP-binding protein n=1 Tax=Pseudobacteriovorax antillogorgiicola TaxID=1513793 RepID=UPI001F43966D|nr:AAA family ATPase [Pseudobacteriovorax antillogorgiicola]